MSDRPQSTDLSRPLLLLLAADAIIVGAGYVLGPAQWHSSGTLTIVRDLGLPMPVWGGLFVAVGALLLGGARTTGHALGLVGYTFWGLATLATLLTAQITAWGGPWHVLALAAVHGLGLWRHTAVRIRTGGSR